MVMRSDEGQQKELACIISTREALVRLVQAQETIAQTQMLLTHQAENTRKAATAGAFWSFVAFILSAMALCVVAIK